MPIQRRFIPKWNKLMIRFCAVAWELSQFLRQLVELYDFVGQMKNELSDFFGQLTFLGNYFELVTICNRLDSIRNQKLEL